MSKINYRKVLSVALALYSACSMFAQSGAAGSYSPYSVFGIGDIYKEGTAYSRGMGSVGIAGRDRRYLNYVNPGALTARDTLSFMMDFSLYSQNKIFRQGNMKSANNTFNISNIAFSFPVYKKSAMIFGIAPYSDVGYDFSYYTVNSEYGVASSVSSGNGSVYQLFGGGAVTLWKNLSIGAQAIYYFGNIDKSTKFDFSVPSLRDISSGYIIQLEGVAGKFGAQYEIPIKDVYLTLGATYRTGSRIGGFVKDYKFAESSSKTDTLSYRVDTLARKRNVRTASEFGIGISLRKPEKWSVELDYIYSDWGRSGFNTAAGFSNLGSANFSTTFSQSVRAG